MEKEKDRIIPIVESKVFIDHPTSRFALGKVAVNGVIVPGFENEFNGIAQLRANTYLEKGFIGTEDLDGDGTELDKNDQRSAHFVILERTAVDSLARVVGNMRLVIKNNEDSTPLPVEGFCPDAFEEKPVEVGGVEVSRLIAHHEDKRIQGVLKWPLFVAGHKYTDYNQLGPVYGLITPALTRLLNVQHIPVSAVASDRYIEEINATKQPVIIDQVGLGESVKMFGDQGVDITKDGFSYLDMFDSSKENA